MRKYFGTDGIRGVANREITAELALRLGSSAARVLLRRPHGVSVLIGRDPRISGDMLESALAAGFASRGADVILVGVIPTPGIAFLVRHEDADVGCVISASHNSLEYNGIKFFGRDGEKLPDETESAIEAELEHRSHSGLPTGINVGRFFRQPERIEHYMQSLKGTCAKSLKGLKIVVDGGNGAAYEIAPRTLEELGAEVVRVECAPNGENINAGCGSLHPQRMLARVVEEGADAGLSFDGDADRVIMGTAAGELVDGDKILAICAIDMATRGALPGRRVVATVMSNLGLEKALQVRGLVLDRVDEVGDRYVAERMRGTGAAIGGEKSGHIIFSQHATTGDGIMTALQVLSVMQSTGRPLSDLASVVEELPQVLDGVRVSERDGWDQYPAIRKAISDAAGSLQDRGRIHVRPSGTEPLIRVMAEGPDQTELQDLVGTVCSIIRDTIGAERV